MIKYKYVKLYKMQKPSEINSSYGPSKLDCTGTNNTHTHLRRMKFFLYNKLSSTLKITKLVDKLK